MKLLTTSNPKMLKGTKYGYLPCILHLAPARLSGYNVCPLATAGCEAACLNTAGHGGIGLDEFGLNSVQRARIRKTREMMGKDTRAAFMEQLVKDVAAAVRKADRDGLIPCIRLNGTSDLRWEHYAVDPGNGRKLCGSIMEAFPAVQFYDYTKLPNRRTDHLSNYHLTFSQADGNADNAAKALDNGMSVAVVVRDPAKPRAKVLHYPDTYNGRPVIDGDESDLRFLDPPGCYVMLRAKGRACTDTSGFVIDIPGTAG